MNTLKDNNKVKVAGIIASDFRFSHEVFGEKFYLVDLEVERKSGTADLIPLMISERLMDMKYDYKGCPAEVVGAFRSFNTQENGKSRLKLSVYAHEIYEFGTTYGENNKIFLEGFVYKEPIYRKTPRGKEIAGLLIAVNRPYGKSDYIPCIAWGRNAGFASGFEVGTKLNLEGRIQSRTYNKQVNEHEIEERICYEVSINKLKVLGANR